jgi:hypothetical protein
MADRIDYDDLDLTLLTVEQLRNVYRFYRRAALYGISEVELAEHLDPFTGSTPVGWIEAIKTIQTECDKCSGSGTYQWGACINGRMTHSGSCFRCEGKGYQTMDDFRRNRGYDQHAVRRVCAEMVG